MIEFIIAAAPRSGTAWAANWLTTESTHCFHDPFWSLTLDELENLRVPGKRFGVACTGVALFSTWLEKHPARKLIVHRDIHEIDLSLRQMGLDPLPPEWTVSLGAIKGMHVHWRELFSHPKPIWEYLVPDTPFDEVRHRNLVTFNVQMDFEALDPDPVKVCEMLKRAGL